MKFRMKRSLLFVIQEKTMGVRELVKLSHTNISAHRSKTISAILTISIIICIPITIAFVNAGSQNVTIKYSDDENNGQIYIACLYEDGQDVVIKRADKYHGEIVSYKKERYETNKHLNFEPSSLVIFDNFDEAIGFYLKNDVDEFEYNPKKFHIAEIISDRIGIYEEYKKRDAELIRPAIIISLITSSLIAAFTLAHIISQDSKLFTLYKTLGATNGQIVLIYFLYILELYVCIIIISTALSILLSLIISAIEWNNMSNILSNAYPNSDKYPPILIGVNYWYPTIVGLTLLSAPVSFLLCIDQFSSKKIALRLKGE